MEYRYDFESIYEIEIYLKVVSTEKVTTLYSTKNNIIQKYTKVYIKVPYMGHVPSRLCYYDYFMSYIPPFCRLL